MTWIGGVEEAGRGPVIGPMVMCCLWCEDEDELRRVGAKDSKQLTPQQRENVFEALSRLRDERRIGFAVKILAPAEIDAAVQGEGDNLNLLEARTSARLVAEGLAQRTLHKVIVDCPTRNTKKYEEVLNRELDRITQMHVQFVAENKADENYPVVGAASVVAKVTRDREIAKLQEQFGVRFGSGYPADPLTQGFLRENYKNPDYAGIFRRSWGTYKNLAQRPAQTSLFHYETEADKEKRAEKDHNEELKAFEVLLAHGFSFETPKQYEVVRMKGPGAVVIKYTTGTVLVQGTAKDETERLLASFGISAKKDKRGRPKKAA